MKALIPAVLLAAALSGCGGSSAAGAQDPAGAPTGAASPAACTSQAPVAPAPGGDADLGTKPTIEIPDTPPPCNLVISDLVTGTGAVAEPGQQVTVKYVGVTYADGNEFDASWGGQDFSFQLGAGQVIAGWDQGVAGMKVGGRRQLVIPSELGYGPNGSGPIPPGATLVFVVDLVKVG